MKKNLSQKCKKIKLVLTDVDGVLTDGGRYYSKTGEELKKMPSQLIGTVVDVIIDTDIRSDDNTGKDEYFEYT